MTAQSPKKITVLVVDDHPPIRAGIRAMLEKIPDIHLIGEAETEHKARRLLDEFRPNVVLLDLIMPGFSPAAFEKWARDNYPETVTLVLTAHDRDAYLANMMQAGVAGYISKNTREDQLIDAIRRAACGETLFDERQEQRVERWRTSIEKKWNALSPREKEILRQLAEGLNNKTISSNLEISLKTVEKHLEGIYRKLGVPSRAKAVLWGREHGRDFPY